MRLMNEYQKKIIDKHIGNKTLEECERLIAKMIMIADRMPEKIYLTLSALEWSGKYKDDPAYAKSSFEDYLWNRWRMYEHKNTYER